MVGRALGFLGNRGSLVATAAAVAAATLPGWLPSGSSAADQPSRFSLAGGCYSLAPASSGQPIAAASRLRLQATRLGSYLLFGTAGDFFAASGAGVVHDDRPSPASDWQVEGAAAGSFTLSPASAPDRVLAATGAGLALVPRDGAGGGVPFPFRPRDRLRGLPRSG